MCSPKHTNPRMLIILFSYAKACNSISAKDFRKTSILVLKTDICDLPYPLGRIQKLLNLIGKNSFAFYFLFEYISSQLPVYMPLFYEFRKR